MRRRRRRLFALEILRRFADRGGIKVAMPEDIAYSRKELQRKPRPFGQLRIRRRLLQRRSNAPLKSRNLRKMLLRKRRIA